MESSNIMKLIVLAASRYCSSQDENTSSQLLSHLEILWALLKKKDLPQIFNDKNTLATKCLIDLLDLVALHNTDNHLMCKIFQLLDCLVSIPNSSYFLGQVFSQANSSLSDYILQHSAANNVDHPLLQCLLLFEKTTYASKLTVISNGLDKLVDFLLMQIDDSQGEAASICLGILSNIVACNVPIQAHVKGSMETSRVRNLMNYLKQNSMSNKVNVLSIVTHACWGDELTKKLYNLKNVTQTLKLLLSCLSNFEYQLTQHRAADLFVELLKHHEISQQFSVYESDQNCASRLVLLLQNDSNPAVRSKILKVLFAFCQISLIRSNMCDRILYRKQPWEVLLKCASCPVTVNDSVSCMGALDLIYELCEESVDATKKINEATWLNPLLTVLTQQLKVNDQLELLLASDAMKCLKWIKILNCLCNDDEMKVTIAANFNISNFSKIIEHQLTHNLTGLSDLTRPDWNDVGIDVVLQSLQLVLSLKHHLPELERLLYSTLQDPRIVPILAQAITGNSRIRVGVSLKLHQEALPLPDYPAVLLSEKISQINQRRASSGVLDLYAPKLSSQTLLDKARKGWSVPVQPYMYNNNGDSADKLSVTSGSSMKSDSDDQDDIRSLISKVQQNNIEVTPTSDETKESKKASDLMEIYENKLASFITKGNHLQDLLEAKTLALSQADRLINQYRCQQARCEEDALKMADMLRESEGKCEKFLEDARVSNADRSVKEQELRTVVEENCHLHNIADQYDKMQFAYQDKVHKIEVLERNLKTSRQEYDTLQELHDMIQKHNEKMKEQQSHASTQLEEMEEDRMKLLKRISELEVSMTDLTQLVEEQDRAARNLMQEKMQQESDIKNLTLQLNKREESIKDLRIKVSSQEQRKQQIEHQMKERNSEVKKLHGKIDSLNDKLENLNMLMIENHGVLSGKDEEIASLQQKLEKKSKTLLMITELSNNGQESQS